MSPLTRRRALLAAATGIVTGAGCLGGERPTIDQREDERPIDNYDVRRTRKDERTLLFAEGETVPTVSDDDRGQYTRLSQSVVISEEELAALTFDEVPEAQQLRSFSTATDFESSSLFLIAKPVEACYEVNLQSVSVDWSELERGDLHPNGEFCKTYRPADVDCDADDVHTAGFAIRLPVAADRSTESGRGTSSSCDPSSRDELFEATVTPVGGGENE